MIEKEIPQADAGTVPPIHGQKAPWQLRDNVRDLRTVSWKPSGEEDAADWIYTYETKVDTLSGAASRKMA